MYFSGSLQVMIEQCLLGSYFRYAMSADAVAAVVAAVVAAAIVDILVASVDDNASTSTR